MNKRLIVLLVALVAVLGVAGYMYLGGDSDSAQTGQSGRNKNVKVYTGTKDQAIVQGVVKRGGKAVAGTVVEIHKGSAGGPLAGASRTGDTGVFVFGALEKTGYVLTAKGAQPVKVTVKGNGITKADITLS